ncbi:MAG TPA: TetR/AcrR family transcriptional regulator [Ramlibacter sp.]|nr:TetR/AcrR family transcriptional regulator [Ramlibacter sp.]
MARKPINASVDTRENLMRLAARSFSTQGYSATTMRGIAEQAGIEAASIYYHYASKEELVDAVMAHGAERIVEHVKEHMDAVPANADARQRFRAALIGQMSAVLKYGDYAMAHNRLLAQLPEKARDRQVKRRADHQKLWTSVMDDLLAQGFLRADVDVHLCRVFALGFVNSVQTWFDPKKGALERVADQFCSVFFEGASPVKAAAPVRRAAKLA